MEKRQVSIKSGDIEVQMEVTQEKYSSYMRPWWAQQQRAKRNRDAMEERGYTKESYEDWKDSLADEMPVEDDIEELVDKKLLLELLNTALESLLPDEKDLAVKVLTNEMSLSEYAINNHTCRTTMSDKKRRVLNKLRSIFKDNGYDINND